MNIRTSVVVLALSLCLVCACGDDGSSDNSSSNAATAGDGGAVDPCAEGEQQICLPVQHEKPPVVCHCIAD